jgi:predicted RNA-binding protein with PUA-like domain
MTKKLSRGVQYWLMKSEPHVFSIDDLAASPQQTIHWHGVRNYQARNTLRDDIQIGDKVLFYHSSCATPAVVGTAKIVRAGYPDHTAWDENSDYPDPKSTPENPRWYMVDVKLDKKLPRPITLTEMRLDPALASMGLLRKGNRLSVQPVSQEHFEHIVALSKQKRTQAV